jgi:hypothetical protein
MQKRVFIAFLFMLSASGLAATNQNTDTLSKKRIRFFAGYELGEMVFNRFRFFAGEAGVCFSNKHLLRLTCMNVMLTEKHLASGFANVVSGRNVEGRFIGYEVFYDVPVYKGLYAGVGAGYYNDYYRHIQTGQSVQNKSATAGFELCYRETELFKTKGAYFNLAIPFRFYFNPLEPVNLNGTKVNRHFFENNIWFFVGYEF